LGNLTPKALEGIKVLDLSRVLAGPWCTQILADFGADVIKIEAPEGGDDTRRWGPPNLPLEPGRTGAGESAYYLSCNRNKRSVAIDFAKPEGAALIRRLAEKADIVVENFKRGGLKKYSLDYDSLKAVNPRLIYCSVTGFGQSGPYADRPGYDFVAQAMGGMMSITGEADGPPIKPGVAMADLSTGMYATVSIMMALRHAERTGEGQCAMLANQALSYLVSGHSPERLGNAHPTVVPYQVFEARDGPIVIAVGNNGQFAALCDVLGVLHLAADPRFVSNADRVKNRAALIPLLQEELRTHSVAELMTVFPARNVPAGPVNTVGQIFDDPFVKARGTVHHFNREDGVQVPSVAFPAKLSATPASFDRAPPRLGENSREVLGDWLGLTDADLATLEARGVVSDRNS
jgi:crotonobetainyl-CoA:carnitine CoA-transferase CaiB-like acyl-CoA transferase